MFLPTTRPLRLLERQEEFSKQHLAARRREVRALIDAARSGSHLDEAGWLARTFPVLSILAPAQQTSEGKIEYPGDPMCLYGALSVAISEVQKAKLYNFDRGDPYNDLCPQWGWLPSAAYRDYQGCGSESSSTGPLNTDETIFDPRVWNEESKALLLETLHAVRPSVVLVSAVSCAHRYALDIAKVVKAFDPACLVVFGGRHADETVQRKAEAPTVDLAPSATLRVTADGRAADCVDVVISGECYWALDLLLKAIALAMPLGRRKASVDQVVESLSRLPSSMMAVPGRSVICARLPDSIACLPLAGRSFDMSEIPNPYLYFAIRAKFPIFKSPEGVVQTTAHLLTTSACPYRCSFCSEGVGVVGRLLRVRDHSVEHTVRKVVECIKLGAEAAFFDDSVLFAGNVQQMCEFSRCLAEIQHLASRTRKDDGNTMFGDPVAKIRAVHFQWGAQLTGEFLATFRTPDEALALLTELRRGGCTYIYLGLESLATEVIGKIHKNRMKTGGSSWEEKVRTALDLIRQAGLRAGTAVLFGLDGETRATIDYTIEGVGKLIDDGLVEIASPSILTYHPGTEITRLHGMADKIDYHTPTINNKAPYLYFEQAFPGVISKLLSERDIWHIHYETKKRWGFVRNDTPMLSRAPAQPAGDRQINREGKQDGHVPSRRESPRSIA